MRPSENRPPNEGSSARHQRDLVEAAWRQFEQARATAVPGATRLADDSDVFPLPTDAGGLPGYRVIREIHRGGQGVVFECVQESTQRTVAVKVMRSGPLSSPQERARFEREVQILATLRHPNIVTVHDSGRVADGAFFVMDYIDGEPLDQFVDHQQLNLRARLRLFVQVCAAVNAAHLRGVIHRDIKPSNIRVDRDGQAHVLDFGLARFLLSENVELHAADTIMTETGQFVGSLPWASPEQVEGRQEQIDIRTDVYSLGVVLFQLLTGSFPYDVSGPLREAIDNIVNTLPRPPRALNRQLDAELVTIVLKALRKDREERYQSAGDLGRDIERYLAGEPISAKRDSLSYVLRKHLARHRITAGIAAGYVLLITVGFGAAVTLWRQATVARNAEARLRVVAQQNAEQAVADAAKANAISRFLEQMLLAADPIGDQGPNVTVRETLDAAARRIEAGGLKDEPLVEAAARDTIGMTYLHLGLLEPAAQQLERAAAQRRDLLGPAHLDLARTLSNLGELRQDQGRLDEAEALLRESAEMLGTLGLGNGPAMLDVQNNLAMVLRDRGQLEAAAELFAQVVAQEREQRRGSPVKRATSLNNYGLTLRELGRLDEAEPLFRESLALLREAYGDEHPYVAGAMENLGAIYVVRGDYATAEPLYREVLAIRRRTLGDEHPEVATSLNNLGYLLMNKGDLDEAEGLFREAIALRRKQLGDDHPRVAMTLNNLGLVLLKKEDYAAAEPVFREALAIKQRTIGPEHPSTLLAGFNLASLLRRAGETHEAIPLMQETIATAERAYPPDRVEPWTYKAELGVCLAQDGQAAAAETLLREVYPVLRDKLGAEHERTRGVATKLAELAEQAGRSDEAAQWRAKAAPPTDPTTMP